MSPQEIFENNQKLVFYVIKKLRANYQKERMQLEFDDMVQVGYIGLWKAAKGFDISKDYKFATYAVPTIMGEILKEIRDRNGLFKVPRDSKLIAKKISKRLDNIEEYGIPTIEEVVEEFGCSADTARIAIEFLFLKVDSLSTPITVGQRKDVYIEDIISDENARFEDNLSRKEEIIEKLSMLTERERFVIYKTMDEVTQVQIGKMLGLSQVQVSRIYKKALSKLEKLNEVNANENEPQFA